MKRDKFLRVARWWTNSVWLSSVYGGLPFGTQGKQVQPAPVCHPCRGFLVIPDPFPHRFRGGLSCGVPFQAGSKSPTRQVPPPKRYGTQREGGSLRYGDGA
jgi:hypothetical protein